MYTPSLESFLNLAQQGNLIPVTRRILADFETPLSAYHKIRGQGESFLFESVEGGEHLGRYSFVGCNPRAVIRQAGDHVELIDNGKVSAHFIVSHHPPGSAEAEAALNGYPLQQTMTSYGKVEEYTVSYAPDAPPGATIVKDGLEVVERVMKKYHPVSLPSLPRFTGGAVGFIGY